MNSYAEILKRRLSVYVVLFCFPLAVYLFSLKYGEQKSLLLGLVYVLGWIFYAAFVYLSTSCPNCKQLFFSAVYSDKKIKAHKFLLNKECNHCGYSGIDKEDN